MKYILTLIVVILTVNLQAQTYKTHKVEAGETIEQISKKYLITPHDVYALNPDARYNFQPNLVLIIPDSKVKNDPANADKKVIIGYKKHKVRRKETLYSISKKYNIQIEDIITANSYLTEGSLRKGNKIKIPEFKIIKSQVSLINTVKKYTVQPKEGKWRVAYKYGISTADLEALNPNMSDILQPGDELNVPNIEITEEKPTTDTYKYYEVLPKEGFYRLKIKLGLTQEQLESLNPDLKDSGLKVGMILKLPLDTTFETTDENSFVGRVDLKSRIVDFETKQIALLLPYRLHLLNTNSSEVAVETISKTRLLSAVLDFHEGVLMALDSAKQLGISTKLKVLDTRYEPSKVSTLLAENNFSNYDAVIGPMQPQSFNIVANALKDYNVPVIAATTKPTQLYSNVFQTIPNKNILRKAIIDFVKKDSTISKVVIISDYIHRRKSLELKEEFPNAKFILSRKNKKGADAYFIYPNDLRGVFPDGKTVVFLETKNESFANSVISMLNGLSIRRKEIILTTTNKNKAFENDKINNYLSNLKFHYASINMELDDSSLNAIIDAYKTSHQGTLPSKYVLRGFDVTLDILMRLSIEDGIYTDHVFETEHLGNRFKYKKLDTGGYINEATYIVKYDDLRIVKAN